MFSQNDGDLDVFFAFKGGNNELWRKDGVITGTTGWDAFTKVTGSAATSTYSESYSAAWFDFDRDVLHRLKPSTSLPAMLPAALTVTHRSPMLRAPAFEQGDLDLFVGNIGFDEFLIYEHCPGAIQIGTSAACTSLPLHAHRAAYSNQAYECEEHQARDAVITQCVNCPPGFVRALGDTACSKCPAGYAQVHGEGMACEPCETGQYANFEGSV